MIPPPIAGPGSRIRECVTLGRHHPTGANGRASMPRPESDAMKLQLCYPPEIISGAVARICSQVSDHAPARIAVRSQPWAVANKCAWNVAHAVEKFGGEAVLGWKVEVWPSVLVNLIGHAVWQKDDGEISCITPQHEGHICFLRDDSITFDYRPESRMGGRSVPLSSHRDVHRFIAVDEAIYAIKAKYPPTSGLLKLYGQDAENCSALQAEKAELTRRILVRHHDLEAPCICKSGRKFKKCCRNSLKQEGALRLKAL